VPQAHAGWAIVSLVGGFGFAACAPTNPSPPPTPRAAVETVTVKDPDLEQRAARAQVRLLEDEALISDLEVRLDDARQEVVRVMAKLQTVASRAEAASGIAEAQIALDSLKAGADAPDSPEIAQAAKLLQMGSAEFDRQNYGGALYLANQAKSLAGAGRGLFAGGDRGSPRPGEVRFALPVPLRTLTSGRVHDSPGAGSKVLFTLAQGAAVTASSYVDAWLRITDDQGRSGWVYYTLVGKAEDTQ
jgi:hypothetical protein